MKAFRSPASRPQRRGFTLIELLVVITIIGILASLILPGVQNVRATARRTECLSNMRQVGVAAINYATTNGALPPLTQPGYNNGPTTGAGATNTGVDMNIGGVRVPAPWTVMLLPQLDQEGLYDRLTGPASGYSAGESLTTLLNTTLKVYNCPSDLNSSDPGAISFVANAGYMQSTEWSAADSIWNGGNPSPRANYYLYAFDSYGSAGASASRQVTRSTGAFFRQDGVALDSMSDGTSQTIMLSENNDTRTFSGFDGSTGNVIGGWASSEYGDISFAVPVANSGNNIADNSSVLGLGRAPVAPATANKAKALELNAGFNLGTAFPQGQINGGFASAVEGRAPRPSSQHPQVVNVIFADGSGKNLAQTIDDSVYARLVTSGGNKLGQSILSDF
ncbi:MAG: DUF1559 domain-containing protein [Planctomycetaceae bacterium]